MAETVEEQMLYGSHCVHGTNLGTPGGADLMCGACELGFTKWVEDPHYKLFYSLDGEVWTAWGWTWYESWYRDPDLVQVIDDRHKAIMEMAFSFAEHLPDYIIHYEVREIDSGYWEEADDDD